MRVVFADVFGVRTGAADLHARACVRLVHLRCFSAVVATDVYCKLTPNVSSEKIWVWTVMDFAEGELKNEQFALKFGQIERKLRFNIEECGLKGKTNNNAAYLLQF